MLLMLLLSTVFLGFSQSPQESTAQFNVGVAIVIDVSGSMDYQWSDGVKIDSAKAAALDLLNLIKIEDDQSEITYQATLIEFSGEARVIQPLTSNFSLLKDKVNELSVDGGTNIGDSLEKAYEQIDLSIFDRSYIVLLSDGVTNNGRTPAEILDWLREKQGGVVPKDFLPQASVYGFDYEDGVDFKNTAKLTSDYLNVVGYGVKLHTEFSEDDGKGNDSMKEIALDELNKDVFFSFYGHANKELLGFRRFKKGILERDSLTKDDLSGYQFNQLKLAVLGGCKTASILDDRENIATVFVQRGAKASMGFKDYGNTTGISKWVQCYYRHLFNTENPKSVYESYKLAILDYDFKMYRLPNRYVKQYGYHYYYAILPRMYYQSEDPVYLVETDTYIAEIKEPDSFKPRIYTVGLGDRDHFDEDLLRNIAQITDGKYFHGAQSFGLTNSFVSTQHHGTGEVVSEFEGQIYPDETINAGKINLDKRQDDLRISLNWPGSQIDLQLVDPKGKIVDENYKGLKVWRSERPAYFVLDRPRVGEWSVMLHGKEVSLDGTSYYVVASVGDIVGNAYDETLLFLVIFAFLLLIALLLSPLLFGSKDRKYKGSKV